MHTTAKSRAHDTVGTIVVPLFPRLAWGSDRSAFDDDAADAPVIAPTNGRSPALPEADADHRRDNTGAGAIERFRRLLLRQHPGRRSCRQG